MDFQLTEIELDALREAANIGAGNAATSLSKMLEKRIRVQVSALRMLDIGQVAGRIAGADKVMTAIYFYLRGSASGGIMLIFSPAAGKRLALRLLGRDRGPANPLDGLEQSALKELGNIFTGTYLTALAEVVNLRFTHSVPGLATDMLQAVLDGVLIESASKAEHVLMFDTLFGVEDETVPGHVLFFPDAPGLKTLLGRLHLQGEKKGRVR